MPKEPSVFIASGGQDAASHFARVGADSYERGVNFCIRSEKLATRPRVRVIELSGSAIAAFADGNVQGAILFDASKGQGANTYGARESIIVASVAGNKIAIRLGDGAATVEDVSNGHRSDPSVPLVFFSQWESYLLAGDERGNTWIWDGKSPAETSTGYDNVNREKSMVPNGCGVMAYSHGRGCAVVDKRRVLVGDILNARDQASARDVLFFREQGYFATGQYFSPPTMMGDIQCAESLASQDTRHGHGELLIHCSNGVFSIDLNVFPRTKWSDTPMVKTALIGGGACGPYAICTFDGDQMFRSKSGVKTLRSAAAEPQSAGNPRRPISLPVGTFFKSDSQEYLQFASVCSWESESTAYVTCYPIVSGSHRWHRGAVAINFLPSPSSAMKPAWEGLVTLPPSISGIIQLISGDFSGTDRMLAICRGDDGKNRLIEFRTDIDADILEGGVESPVRSQLVTRWQAMNAPFDRKNISGGRIVLTGVRAVLKWGVWYRGFGVSKWTLWRSGCVSNDAPCGDCIEAVPDWSGEIPLGSIPDESSASTRFQFLIRTEGICEIESLIVEFNQASSKAEYSDASLKVCVTPEYTCGQYDDYEYSGAENWAEKL